VAIDRGSFHGPGKALLQDGQNDFNTYCASGGKFPPTIFKEIFLRLFFSKNNALMELTVERIE